MDKTLSVFLIATSLIFTCDHASANESKEFITESDDQSTRSRRSDKDSDDSKESRKEQTKGYIKQKLEERRSKERDQDQNQKRDIEQKRDSANQMNRNLETEKKIKETQERRSKERDQDQNQKRDIEQKRDSANQMNRNLETEKKIKEIQERRSKERDQDRDQKKEIERKKESSDQKRDWKSEKRDAVKTLPDGFRDRGKDQKDDRRERISKERFKEKEIRWQSKSKVWRKNFSNYRTRDHIFDDHFWDRFRKRHHDWNFDNNFQWYSGTTWPRIVVWLPWQWSQPVYYFYETDGDVYYSSTENFSYLTPVDSKEIFIEEAARIANGRYPISKEQSDWMPLGMFTFASDNDASDTPKSYISLAISKLGAVSGAYFDVENNTTLEIQGGIDPQSQRIAWKFIDQDWPIMESGLYNFTKEESTLLIHTSSRTTETQLLIKLDN